jgi:hypothetical protein
MACTGCGESNGIYPVSGRVTYQGSPAAGAFVFFHRQGTDSVKEQTMMAVVQADGTFSVDCGSLGKGAPPGEYSVLIQWRCDPSQPSARSPTEAASRPDRLKGHYSDPNHPLLSAVVRAQANVLTTFELSDQP